MERYELNMQRHFQSLVPMERATWNLANSGVHVNFALFAQIRFFLQRCIFNLVSALKRLKEQRVRIFQQVNQEVTPLQAAATVCLQLDVQSLFLKLQGQRKLIQFYTAVFTAPLF